MKKMFLALVVFVICFGIFTTGPFAASVANNKSGDGLVLSIDSDKDHYAADEDISVSITAGLIYAVGIRKHVYQKAHLYHKNNHKH